jgi:hypothetical protein
MKIVSKNKYFYDYLVQNHDADIIYVRNIDVLYELYDKLYASDKRYTPYYGSYYGYYGGYRSGKEKDGCISFGNYVFGVYPNVYSQPLARVKYTSVTDNPEYLYIILTKQIVDDIILRNDISSLVDFSNKEIEKVNHFKEVKCFVSYSNPQKTLPNYVWKLECKEIFEKLKSPVWTKFDTSLYEGGAYWNFLYDKDQPRKRVHYVKDICFNKLNNNILKYWYNELNDINTYINIENFLWSIKQEPVSTPDNKTKILSHGFDLKTSFRKM